MVCVVLCSGSPHTAHHTCASAQNAHEYFLPHTTHITTYICRCALRLLIPYTYTDQTVIPSQSYTLHTPHYATHTTTHITTHNTPHRQHTHYQHMVWHHLPLTRYLEWPYLTVRDSKWSKMTQVHWNSLVFVKILLLFLLSFFMFIFCAAFLRHFFSYFCHLCNVK